MAASEEKPFFVTVGFPRDLHKRARDISKRTKCTIVHLIREGLREKVEFYETKFRSEEERKKVEREERRSRRSIGEMGQLGGLAPLPPSAPTLGVAVEQETEEEHVNPYFKSLYEEQAKKIFEVLERDPIEKRLRVAEAVKVIVREAPLTHPPEKEILAALEKIVIRLRSEQPSPLLGSNPPPPSKTSSIGSVIGRALDSLVGKAVDTNRVKSLGDVDIEE